MAEKIIWHFTILLLSLMGSTTKYFITIEEGQLSFLAWFKRAFIGLTVSILASFLGKHYNYSEYLIYSIVIIASISSKQILKGLSVFVNKKIERFL